MSENKYQKAIRMITEHINYINMVMEPRLLEDKHMHDFVVEKSHECLALLEELVEKSIPKEVNVWKSNDYYHYNCPACEEYFGYETRSSYDGFVNRVIKGAYCYSLNVVVSSHNITFVNRVIKGAYCYRCGQRLDWEATAGKEQTSGKTDN